MNSITLYPSTQFDFSALDRARDSGKISVSTHTKYTRAIERLLTAGIDPRDYDALAEYANGLPHSGRAFLKAGLMKVFRDLEMRIKAHARPGDVDEIQAIIWNIDAIDNAIHVEQRKGERSHLWLSPEQVEQLTSLPDRSTLAGRRDWIVLALLLSGLRREEVASITFDRLTRRPMSNGQMRAVLDITGKGAKDRVVPIKPILETYLLEWKAETGGGNIARSIQYNRLQDSLAAANIYEIVRKYGAMIGLPELAPHDLRRTYAQIGWLNTRDLTLVSNLLGHESLETTKRYLNLKVNLDNTISDYVPLSGD